MLPKHGQKPFWLYKFSGKHVSVWCQKKYLPYTISWRPGTAFLKHFERKFLCICIYLLIRRFLIRSHFLSVKTNVTKKISMGSFKKYVTCIMAFLNPFNYLSHFVNFTSTLSLCYSPTSIRNYRMTEKKFQLITLYQRR